MQTNTWSSNFTPCHHYHFTVSVCVCTDLLIMVVNEVWMSPVHLLLFELPALVIPIDLLWSWYCVLGYTHLNTHTHMNKMAYKYYIHSMHYKHIHNVLLYSNSSPYYQQLSYLCRVDEYCVTMVTV